MAAPNESWRRKLPPVFFELAELKKEFEQRWRAIHRTRDTQLERLHNPTSGTKYAEVIARFLQELRELDASMMERLIGVNHRYPEIPHNRLAYSYLDGQPDDSQGVKFVRYLHWIRHSESLTKTTWDDQRGTTLEPWGKLSRTGEDLRRIQKGIGGVAEFKVDVVHRQFLELILCHATEPLTEDELAECANAYCGCERETHDAGALRKQFARLKRDLEASASTPEVK